MKDLILKIEIGYSFTFASLSFIVPRSLFSDVINSFCLFYSNKKKSLGLVRLYI
jgi:hypothetical protein